MDQAFLTGRWGLYQRYPKHAFRYGKVGMKSMPY